MNRFHHKYYLTPNLVNILYKTSKHHSNQMDVPEAFQSDLHDLRQFDGITILNEMGFLNVTEYNKSYIKYYVSKAGKKLLHSSRARYSKYHLVSNFLNYAYTICYIIIAAIVIWWFTLGIHHELNTFEPYLFGFIIAVLLIFTVLYSHHYINISNKFTKYLQKDLIHKKE